MDLSSNPSKTPTQWDQNSHTSLSCATKRKYFCNRIMWWVRVLGGGDGCTVYWEISRPERKERERTVSQKPRVGRNDHSVVGQAHRGEHHQNKVPTQSRQPRAASNSDNALNQGPYRMEGLPNQDLMIKIISSCQNKTTNPYKMCKSLPRKLKMSSPMAGGILPISGTHLNTLVNLWQV